MRDNKTILLFCLLLLVNVCGVLGQSPADSLSAHQVTRLKEIAAWKSNWDVARDAAVFVLPILTFLFGGLFTYLAIRNRFQKWAEEEITKKASEKVGLDWNVLKHIVDERKALLTMREKVRVAIVNHSTGKRSDFIGLLRDNGYPEPEFFTFIDTKEKSKKLFKEDFKQADFQLILIDNEDGKLSDTDITVDIIEKHKQGFGNNFIWYTKADTVLFKQFQNQVAFVKQWNYLLENLDGKL